MGSHKRSFQCFDAILDEPSLKPSWSSGHQSVASHGGFPSINRPQEDRECYLCADHQQAVTMTSEASGTYSPWFHYQTHPHAHQHVTRRSIRAEEAAGEDEDHHHHRHSRRIVLVKNSDPAVRRTIVLHRRSLRSLGLFMEEVSELLQCLIRKIYTLDGHKVDSVQSLLQCSGVLVCVGREPFHPLLLDSVRKNSHDKLPKLNLKSRSSVDEKTAKKNVNFGLETKRSVIHSRSDSSNRSARLMMSSEKSFPNGLNSLPPGHPGACPHNREGLMDDDIEKRVLVNKDGSLSMEMKVRFRLLHDETLHWSTEIKKSTGTLNESHAAHDDACCISHGSAESCSEAESLLAGEAEETYNTKRYQKHYKDPHCQHCCAQSQEYNIWKNPILPDQTAVRHIRSSSSSTSSCRIIRKKTSTDSMQTMSSEEYTEHVVEKATCIEQTFGQQGDTTVKHCTINCCCRRSEVCSVSSKTKRTGSAEEKCAMAEKIQDQRSDNNKDSQKEQLSLQITEPTAEEERPVSTVSSSSQILASLKEDQDEEDLELPSISRTSHDNDQQDDGAGSNPCSDTPSRSPASMTHLSPKPPSKSSLGRSKTCRKFTPTETDQDDQTVRPGSAESALSKALSGCRKRKCLDSKKPVPPVALENMNVQPGTEEGAPTEMLATSPACSQEEIAAESAEEHSLTEERPSSAISIKSNTSGRSNKSNGTEELEKEHSAVQDGRVPSAISTKFQRSENSKSEMSENVPEDQETEVRTSSAMSAKSNISGRSKRSKISENGSDQCAELQDNIEERTVSVMSGRSNISAISSLSKEPQSVEAKEAEEEIEERASNAKSATSNTSGIEELTNDEFKVLEELEEREQDRSSSRASQKSKSEISDASSFQVEEKELQDQIAPQVDNVVPDERCLSSKSNISTTSKVSEQDQEQIKAKDKEEIQERASSAISAKSFTSSRSRKSEATPTAAKKLKEEIKERASSAMSSKSKASQKSKISSETPEEQIDREETEKRGSSVSVKSEVSTDVEQLEQRASSAISAKSNLSAASRGSKDSEDAEVEPTKLQDDDQLSAVSHTSETLNPSNECGTAAEEMEVRTPSALSTKSHTSVKSKTSDLATVDAVENSTDFRSASAMSSKSKVSEIVIEEPIQIEDQNEGRAQSALSTISIQSGISENVSDEVDVAEDEAQSIMSSKSNASRRSRKSNISKIEASLPQGAEHQTEERTHSALSAKSNISAKSKKSNASAAVEADGKDQKDRAPSTMSGRSHISTKSSISAKSKTSRISEVSPQEPDDEEHEEKASIVLSTKSSISVRSSESKHSKIVHGDPAEVESKDRPPSAVSTDSNTSAKSRSVISEATYNENEISNEGEIKERALSATSTKTKSSVRTRTSKVSEIMIDELNQQKVERASSSRSDVSERSVTGAPDVTGSDVEERAPSTASVTSAKSKRSNISNKTENTGNEDAEDSVRSSAVLAKSNASTKSKTSLFLETEKAEERSTSVASSSSVVSKASKADVEKKSKRSPSQLSAKSNVSARSRKSKVSETEDHRKTPTNNTDMETTRDESLGVHHSKVSQTLNSNKCVCEAVNKSLSPMVSSEKDSDHEEVPMSPRSIKSAKSKISSTSERVLTPTSTSVSIGIIDDCEDDDVEKIDEDVVSVNSRTSASSQTEMCATSDKDLLQFPVQETIERATQTPEERSKSFTSAKSKISETSKSKHSHSSSALPTVTALEANHPSANCSVKQSSPTQEIRSSSKASNASIHSCGGVSAENTAVTSQGAAASPDVSYKSQSTCSKCRSSQDKGKMSTEQDAPVSPVSSASAISDSTLLVKSRKKDRKTVEMIDRPDSNISNSSYHLQVNNQNIVEASVSDKDGHSVKSNKSCKKSTNKNEEDMDRGHSATLSVTSGNRLSPSPPKSPKKSKKTVVLLRGSNDSVLSQTVPVLHTREENADNFNVEEPTSNKPDRTHNGPQNVCENKSEKSSKCRKRTGSSSSCQKMNDDMSEMSPSCLPNASPTEVVNEWLRKIPSDTALCELGDDFHENFDAMEPLCTSHGPSGETEHENVGEYNVSKLEKHDKVEDEHLAGAEGAVDNKSQENNVPSEGDHQCIRPQTADEPKILDSSVLVMKVLLSPKLDRCNSLPEVSPAYGHKLSTSAQGLLDCLAKLQLLDFGPTDENGKQAKYQELMSMLKSLWLCDPKDKEKVSVKRKPANQQPHDEEFKARSSSGVDVNSGSTSSGKSSVLDGTQAQLNTECEGPDALTKVQEVDETVEALETPESKCDSDTPHRESGAQWTPEGGAMNTVEEKIKDDVPGSDETIRNNDSPRELVETPPSSNISSGNNPKNKEFETDLQEDTSSGSPPAPQRPPLSKRVSQDPDPVWVLNLLNKLEKQFMKHYVNAMDEFKVRWNLDDNEQLDSMICELQHEVHRRIQSSIDRELKKIQGRAGRPRPPKALSRESTAQTEQRRRRLKVMRNQSIDPQPQKSEDDYTATGTDFSDQRSDDEYCPCDTCVKKKIASKPVLPVEMLNSAPVMMDFDLRRILQIKKFPPNIEKIEETASECKGDKMEDLEENVALEAVKEEDEMEGPENLRKSRGDGEKVEKASSTYEGDTSEKQSDRAEEVEETFCTEVVEVEEITEISDNIMTEQNNKEAENDEEKEGDDKADCDVASVNESSSDSKINDESGNITEDAGDVMEVETKGEKAKDKASEEQTEEDRNTADELDEEGEADEGETAEKEQNAETETVEEGERANEDTAEEHEDETVEDENTAEAESERAGESGTAEDETAEDETAEECETAEDKTAEGSETDEDKLAQDCETAEDETAEECETAEDKTAEGTEKDEDKLAQEGETAEDETAEEIEMAEDKQADETAEESQTAENETAEECETAEDETAEECETAEDETAEECETAEDETAEQSETAEDEPAEECKTAEDETAEEGETAKNETKEEGETAEDKTAEKSETTGDETAEQSETDEDETAEEGETAKNETEEDGGTSEDKIAEQSETAEDETAEEGETAKNDTEEESETAKNETEEESETAKNETEEDKVTVKSESTEEGETADEEAAGETPNNDVDIEEEGETASDKATEDGQNTEIVVEDGKTAENDAVEENETANDETSEDEQNDQGTAGESETKYTEEGGTAKDETAEESEISEDRTEDGQTAGEDETANDDNAEDGQPAEVEPEGEGETDNDDTAEECETSVKESVEEAKDAQTETAEDETATADGASSEGESAEESKTADDEHNAEAAVGEGETADDDSAEESDRAEDEAVEDGQTEQSQAADEETAAESANAHGETTDEHTNSVEDEDVVEETADEEQADEDEAETDANKDEAGDHTNYVETTEGMSAEEKQTSEAETVDEETTGAEMSEEKATLGDATTPAEGDLIKDEKNAEEELTETGGHDAPSSPEDTGCDDVIELKADEEVAEKGNSFKNEGDVVIDSFEDKAKESGKEDDTEEVLKDEGHHFADIGESAEGGDEAEDDTEPDMEIDERDHFGKVKVLQPSQQPKPEEDQLDTTTVISFDAVVNHNLVYDADVEDSETEVHNQVQDLSSESEGTPQRKSARTLKMLIHTLAFFKHKPTERPNVREEDGDDEDEHEETPEESDNAEDSSCVEKDEYKEVDGKEKGKLSDITEDTAEDQENETSKDYSEDSERESSENALEKQFTKSSMESQPGSFEEVLEEKKQSQKGSNHKTVKDKQ